MSTQTPRTDDFGNPTGAIYSLSFPGGSKCYNFVSNDSYQDLKNELAAMTERATSSEHNFAVEHERAEKAEAVLAEHEDLDVVITEAQHQLGAEEGEMLLDTAIRVHGELAALRAQHQTTAAQSGKDSPLSAASILSSGGQPTIAPAAATVNVPRNCPAHFALSDMLCRKGCGVFCIVADPEKVNQALAAQAAEIKRLRKDYNELMPPVSSLPRSV